jgi:hypothetical protein
VQELDVDVLPNAAAAPDAAVQSLKVSGQTSFEVTETVGEPDADGRISAAFTWDTVTSDMTLNGAPVSSETPLARLQGQTMTVVYDRQGTPVDLKVPEALAASGLNFKELLTMVAGRMPAATLGIGESASFPFDLSLPMPTAGGAPPRLAGEGAYTLRSIHREGQASIADLDIAGDAKMVSENPAGAGGPITADLRMHVAGTCQWDVNRRYMRASDQRTTVEGTISGGPLNMALHGTIRIRVEPTAVR